MLTDARPIVWSIAGSDSGGGAGIQADTLSIQALGGHAATVITTLTAQNSLGVQALHAVDNDSFGQQLASLADDLPPRAIKIGLLGNIHQVDMLRQALPGWRRRWPGVGVVLDPVLVATSGDTLTDGDMVAALMSLLPHIDLLTPNQPELAALAGVSLSSRDDILAAARRLAGHGCAVLAKGGHRKDGSRDSTVDLLLGDAEDWCFQAERLATTDTHGTGCSLSSAIAVLRARGLPLHDACALARAYLQYGLQRAYTTGSGHGTPLRIQSLDDCLQRDCLPQCGHNGDNWLTEGRNRPFAPCVTIPEGIYPVVPDSRWVRRLLEAGARIIQLRIKAPVNNTVLTREIKQAMALGKHYRAQVFINDHWRQALHLGAYGVHLGQEDLMSADLASIRNAGLRLGVSSHGYAELLRVLTLQPSYVALGHLFPTLTKHMPSQPQGLTRLAHLQRIADAHGVPTAAIGGIKPAHLPALRARGVSCAAVVSALAQAPEPARQLQHMQRLLGGDQAHYKPPNKESLTHD